jgi:tetratricopeptide (TPR) repeat protein
MPLSAAFDAALDAVSPRLVAPALRWRFWRLLGSPDKALVALNEQLDLQSLARAHTHPSPHLLATRAHLLGQLGRWDEARVQLTQLHSLQPHDAVCAYNLGYVCAQLGDAAAAAQAFRACLDQAPQMDQAWFGLGSALADLGDWDGAQAAWEHQVSLQPLCPDGYAQLVRLSVQRHDRLNARAWLDRLRAFAPRHALALEPLLTEPGTPSPGVSVGSAA